jgi:hypothetical protein
MRVVRVVLLTTKDLSFRQEVIWGISGSTW